MKRAPSATSATHSKDVEAQLAEGEEIEIVKHNKVIAKLQKTPPAPRQMPDLLGRMKKIRGDHIFEPSNAELLAGERDRTQYPSPAQYARRFS